MKTIFRPAFILILLFVSAQLIGQVKIVKSEFVDSVVCDFPAKFSSLAVKDWQFVAYYNANRNLTIASKKIEDKNWTNKILDTRVGWDNHNYITMAYDNDFNIHVSGNMHNDSLIYFRTENPFKISTFQRVFPMVTLADELKSTYPVFIKDQKGELFFTYRKGGSGNGNSIVNAYNTQSKTFRRLTDKPLFDGLNEMSAYIASPKLGPDRQFHLTWVWRDTPAAETNHDLSYARSKDLINWENAFGEKVTLPITPRKSQFIVDPIPAKGGAINGGHKLFFINNNPALCYHKYDSKGNHQLYIATKNGKKWQSKKLTNWEFRWSFEGPGSLTNELKILDAEVKSKQIKVTYWNKKMGYGEILVDAVTLKVISEKEIKNPNKVRYPAELEKAEEGKTVQWMPIENNQKDGSFYAFRWEAMGVRRFYEKTETPVPPFGMKLFKFKKK